MGVVVYGHWGPPLLGFPTSAGDEWELEGQGLIGSLSPLIDAGRVKFFSINSVNSAGFYNKSAHPFHRSWVQSQFDAYVLSLIHISDRHHVDQALVKAVINQESGWNAGAVSRKGAIGLMQLIPGTAHRFGAGNPYDPAQNVEAGTTYLRSLLDRYDNNLSLSLAAYNAGERAVDLNGGVPAYRETQQYVQKVTEAYFRSDSGRNPTFWTPPRRPVRKEVDSKGRVVYTNE